MTDIWILSGSRTPFCAWSSGTTGKGDKGGKLKPHEPADLGAHALKGALKRARFSPEAVDLALFANMYQIGPHACYAGRYLAHRTGIKASAPAPAVNFACGSGLYALMISAQEIALGRTGLVGMAGADNVSLARRDVFVPSFQDISCGRHIAHTAEVLAQQHNFSRQDLDRWARLSHERALKAQKAGVFAQEIEPLGEAVEDDAILSQPAPEIFAQSKLLFDKGTATAANTHAIVDGGSALVAANSSAAKSAKPQPLGRYVAGAVVGIEPERMALGSVFAIRKVLNLAKLQISDIDLFEINETFASQTLIDIQELGLSEEKVNVNGGALALGHPFAGTGPRLVLTLLYELKRRGLRRGVASICVGGGQGVAVVVERP